MKNILRNFWVMLTRFKMASILNIVGLAVAFSVFSIIMMQTYWEFSFNTNFKDGERIVRIENSLMSSGNRQVTLSRPIGDGVGEHTPTVESYAAVNGRSYANVSVYDKHNQIVNVRCSFLGASVGFPEVFSLEQVSGNMDRFKEPNSAIVSQSEAEKLFADQDPVGKLVFAGGDTLTVVAVYKDLPKNCTFRNSLIYHVGEEGKNNFSNWNYDYYLKLTDKKAISSLKDKIVNTLMEHFPGDSNQPEAEIKKQLSENLYIVPLEDIYFEGLGEYAQGNKTLTSILIAIAILIIGIAVINFINFFMALVPIRIRAINIHKIFGTPTTALKLNIIGEALGTVLVAFALSVFILYCIQTSFITEFMKNSILLADNVLVIVFTGCIALIVGLLAGLYPAYYITKFPPMMVIRGGFGHGKAGRRLRSTLVTVQYVISIALIIGSLFVAIQTSFMRNTDMGYNRDRLITVPVGDIAKQPDAFLDLLKQNPGIEGVAYSDFNIVDINMSWGRNFKGEKIFLVSMPVSWDYPQFMNFTLVDGRFFIESDASKTSGTMIINEVASKKYGIKVGDFFTGHSNEEAEVVGIVKDFYYKSVKNEIEPVVLYEFGSQGWRTPSVANIRISSSADYKAVEQTISSAMKTLNAGLSDEQIQINPFDESIENLYKSENNLASIISIFSVVAIIISLVGVFGLVVFEMQHRRKEIALRKVHGATSISIPIMINKKFVTITIIAALIAVPLAYVGVWFWLQEFSVKTPLHFWVAIAAVVLVWIITIMIVTFQTFKTATENPIKFLKSE